MFDFLFEWTEYSENEGEQILVECYSLPEAWGILLDQYGFKKRELKYLERMSVSEGEMLGLDTY